jgi:tetratricopeptide (TPR) repeat protein
LRLTGEQQGRLLAHSTENTEAYDAFLKGLYYTRQFTPDSLKEGMTYLRQAVTLDPNYALAYSTIAYNYSVIEDWYVPPREVMPEAEAAAKKAFELDPTLGDAEGWLAYTDHFYNYNQARALQEFQHALELDPNDAEIRAMYGWCLADLKRYDEGVAQNAESLRLDPISAEHNHVLGQTDYYAHRYDDAIRQDRKTIEQFPSTGLCLDCREMCWDGATPRRVNSTTQFKPSNKLAKRSRISRRRSPHSAGLLRSRETAKPHKTCSRNSMPVPRDTGSNHIFTP